MMDLLSVRFSKYVPARTMIVSPGLAAWMVLFPAFGQALKQKAASR
jgi:hypothetical protein